MRGPVRLRPGTGIRWCQSGLAATRHTDRRSRRTVAGAHQDIVVQIGIKTLLLIGICLIAEVCNFPLLFFRQIVGQTIRIVLKVVAAGGFVGSCVAAAAASFAFGSASAQAEQGEYQRQNKTGDSCFRFCFSFSFLWYGLYLDLLCSLS